MGRRAVRLHFRHDGVFVIDQRVATVAGGEDKADGRRRRAIVSGVAKRNLPSWFSIMTVPKPAFTIWSA